MSADTKNIVIAGKNSIAIGALDYLLTEIKYPPSKIAVVINKTDNGNNGWQLSLKKYAERRSVRVLTLQEAESSAEVFFSLEFDQIIKPNSFKSSCLYNIHFSLLPEYKGMYTSIWPILDGKSKVGCTLHRIDRGVDTGEVIDCEEFLINEFTTSSELYWLYLRKGLDLFKRTVKPLLTGSFISRPQHPIGSSYYSIDSFDFSDRTLNLKNTAWKIGRKVKALAFREYQLPEFNGVPIVNYEIVGERSQHTPGTLLYECDSYVLISTIDYNIKLFKDRYTDFIACLEIGDFDSVVSLLKNITSIEDRGSTGWTPLMVAAYHAQGDIFNFLLSEGADVNACNRNGTTVLMYAKDGFLRTGNRKVIDRCLSSGANIHQRDFNGLALADYIDSHTFDQIMLGVKL